MVAKCGRFESTKGLDLPGTSKGVVLMPRPRSKNPSIPRSISLPQSLWLEIDQRLGSMGSTSAWVQRAVREKLENKVGLSTVRVKSLLIEVLCREDFDDSVLRDRIEEYLQR